MTGHSVSILNYKPRMFKLHYNKPEYFNYLTITEYRIKIFSVISCSPWNILLNANAKMTKWPIQIQRETQIVLSRWNRLRYVKLISLHEIFRITTSSSDHDAKGQILITYKLIANFLNKQIFLNVIFEVFELEICQIRLIYIGSKIYIDAKPCQG